jgi:hypothetical protein
VHGASSQEAHVLLVDDIGSVQKSNLDSALTRLRTTRPLDLVAIMDPQAALHYLADAVDPARQPDH